MWCRLPVMVPEPPRRCPESGVGPASVQCAGAGAADAARAGSSAMDVRSGGSNRTIAMIASTSSSPRNVRKPIRLSSAMAVRVTGATAVLVLHRLPAVRLYCWPPVMLFYPALPGHCVILPGVEHQENACKASSAAGDKPPQQRVCYRGSGGRRRVAENACAGSHRQHQVGFSTPVFRSHSPASVGSFLAAGQLRLTTWSSTPSTASLFVPCRPGAREAIERTTTCGGSAPGRGRHPATLSWSAGSTARTQTLRPSKSSGAAADHPCVRRAAEVLVARGWRIAEDASVPLIGKNGSVPPIPAAAKPPRFLGTGAMATSREIEWWFEEGHLDCRDLVRSGRGRRTPAPAWRGELANVTRPATRA